MGLNSSKPDQREPVGVHLPTSPNSPLEFCQSMQFKLTPSYRSQLQARLRWQQVLRSARQRQGGGWQPDFSPADLTPEKLSRLVDLIDKAFLSGSFKRACGPNLEVREQLAASSAGALKPLEICNAVAGFEPATNTIAVFRSGWQRAPSLAGGPMQADGVYCLTKLEWLAHTLAHEMVHCIVHNCCPESREYAAYTDNHGHGPIFTRLNRSLFGHSRVQYRAGWGRLDGRLRVQWGSAGASGPTVLSLPLGSNLYGGSGNSHHAGSGGSSDNSGSDWG